MIATWQEHNCNAPADSIFANERAMSDDLTDKDLIEALAQWTGLKPSAMAKRAGLAVTTLTRPVNQPVTHKLSIPTLAKLRQTFPDFPGFGGEADAQLAHHSRTYVPVEVLPSYAGMGGGGNGAGDLETALIPRALVEDELHAKPSDLILIDVRGDSMEPDFQQGDQLLIDKRDRNPVQPGAFAIFDGDAYVVKLVERVPQKKGWYRVFSANARYTDYQIEEDEFTIVGRPVWFGRRL